MSGDHKTGRRGVLFGLAAATGVAATGLRASAETKPPKSTRRWAMAIDLDLCARCGGCVVACQAENNISPLPPDELAKRAPIRWMDFLFPQPDLPAPLGDEPAPIPCMHCEDPACVKVCPVGATYQTDDGITAQIWERCIGCRSCMVACPYSRRSFNWSRPSDLPSVSPDVALRPEGVVEKCTLCHHRIATALERSRVDDEPQTDQILRTLPACAQSCPAHAITFGDLNDAQSEVARLALDPRAVRLLPELGTRPKVFYLRGRS
jgi:Fe-S-cluster-containing dehydrogenase component